MPAMSLWGFVEWILIGVALGIGFKLGGNIYDFFAWLISKVIGGGKQPSQ
jgi:hypothetical protein